MCLSRRAAANARGVKAFRRNGVCLPGSWSTQLVKIFVACSFSLGLAGCGGLSASSSCKTFLSASQQAQVSAVEALAGKYNTPAYATPLGEPEVAYYCAGNPNSSLAKFFEGARGAGF